MELFRKVSVTLYTQMYRRLDGVRTQWFYCWCMAKQNHYISHAYDNRFHEFVGQMMVDE